MASVRQNVIVGTSGHIDHGKTSLVRALTGTDTDRWEEEKRRGITIDLGFASLDLGDDLRIGFVDVPGHERFVKNMLAGVGGIDIVLLVVAADESVMPQTREHFEICRLLGIRHGLIALTKADAVDEEILELVKLEVDEFVSGSFLDGAPMVPVSSVTGAGVTQLCEALRQVAREVEEREDGELLRLPVDRVFTMKGFGTVVTGTLASGQIRVEAPVEILPGRQQARVRNLEVHGESVDLARAGQRTAINLGGIAKADLERGACLVEPGVFAPTEQFDAHIELLPSAKPLKHAAPVHVHLGTAETVGRAYLLEASGRRSSLKPGESAFVQLRLDNPLVAVSGDRFILRQFSPLTTIAGGTALHPHAVRHRKKADWRPALEALRDRNPATILDLLCAERLFGMEGSALTAITGRRESEWRSIARASKAVRVLRDRPLWVCADSRAKDAEERVLKALEQFHKANPLESGLAVEALRSSEFSDAPEFFADHILQRLEAAKKVELDGDLVKAADHKIRLEGDEREAREQLVTAFEQAGLQVPLLKDLLPTLPIDSGRARRILAALLREGVLVRINAELVFHSTAVNALLARLAPLRGQLVDVGEFKTLANVSRKYAIPLLEHFDKQKVTLRDGNKRRVL